MDWVGPTAVLFAFLAWFALHIICGLWADEAARAKGLGRNGWTLMGFLFGPFTLLALCAMPDLKTQRILRLMAESQGVDLSSPEPPKQKKPFFAQRGKDATEQSSGWTWF